MPCTQCFKGHLKHFNGMTSGISKKITFPLLFPLEQVTSYTTTARNIQSFLWLPLEHTITGLSEHHLNKHLKTCLFTKSSWSVFLLPLGPCLLSCFLIRLISRNKTTMPIHNKKKLRLKIEEEGQKTDLLFDVYSICYYPILVLIACFLLVKDREKICKSNEFEKYWHLPPK